MNVTKDHVLFLESDLDFLFKMDELNKFYEMWADGESLPQIAAELKRKEIEIALLIMDLDYQELIQSRQRGIFGGKLLGESGEVQQMKNGKKPTVKQSIFMEANGVSANRWLVAKDTPDEMICVSRNATGKPKPNQIKRLAKGVC